MHKGMAMNFVRKYQTFVGRIMLLLMAGGMPGYSIFSTAARADMSDIDSYNSSMADTNADLKAAKKQLSDDNKDIAKLGGTDPDSNCQSLDPDDATYAGSCNCSNDSSCTPNDFKVANVDRTTDTDPSYDQCYVDLYNGKPSFYGISSSCAKKIKTCGIVKCQLKVKADQADAQAMTDRINQDKSDLKDDRDGLLAAQQACPNCQAIEAEAEASKPTTGQLVLGGLQTAVGALSVGLGAYTQIHAQNEYYSSYKDYLNQCATIGVPCQGGAGMFTGSSGYGYGGGIGGIGYGGIGGIGLSGGIGVGGYGGYGGYPGIGISGGIGLGGYGGYPSYGGGYGGYPGIGLSGGIGLGTGGYGGYPSYGGYGGYPGIGLSGGIGLGTGGYGGYPSYGGYGGYPGIGLSGGIGVGGYPGGYGYPGIGLSGGIGLGTGGYGNQGYSPYGQYPGYGSGGYGYPGIGLAGGIGVGVGVGGYPGGYPGGYGGYPGGYAGGYPAAYPGGYQGGYPGGYQGGYPGGSNSGWGPANGTGSSYTSGWGAPNYGYGSGFNSSLFPYGSGNNTFSTGGSSASNNIMISEQEAYQAQARALQVMESSYGGGGGYGFGGYSGGYGGYSGGSANGLGQAF
jgi:hypothetical protein